MLAGLSLVNIGLTLTLTLSSKDIIHQYKVLLIESTSDCLLFNKYFKDKNWSKNILDFGGTEYNSTTHDYLKKCTKWYEDMRLELISIWPRL